MNITNNSIAKSLQRLSTGSRVNSASDDAAGFYTASKLNSQIRGLKTAQSNITMGVSMLGVAEGALGDITDMLNRLNDLALQGASNTMSDKARNALTKEANSLVEEIRKLNTNTKFNGTNVFGSVTPPPAGNASAASVSNNTTSAGYTAIYTVDDLKNIKNNLSGKYILMNDIDLSSVSNWDSIRDFAGVLDGNGHVIKNLNSTKNGLFGCVMNAEIKNLGMENVNIISNNTEKVGALVGEALTTTITNCYSTGTITGSNCSKIGGLIGISYSSNYTDCYSLANVNGMDEVGGLIGFVDKGTTSSSVTNCYAAGNISGSSKVGGLIGINRLTKTTNSYATGNVTGTSVRIGGLIGQIDGYGADVTYNTISKCYATGNVKGENATGGLIGEIYMGIVKDCYATGNANGADYVGGLIGNTSRGEISNCYSRGIATGTHDTTGVIIGYAYDLNNVSNILGEKQNSSLNAIGKIGATSTITNAKAVSSEEFKTHKVWDNTFNSDAWIMSDSIPPILKDVGGQRKNLYYSRGDNEIRLQIGANADSDSNALFINTGLDLGAMTIDLSTTDSSLDAVECLKVVLDSVKQKTSDIGITKSRLENISNINTIKIENLTSAYSTVTEADVAEEVANYTKAQILTQTASSLITQTQTFQANLLLRMISSLG